MAACRSCRSCRSKTRRSSSRGARIRHHPLRRAGPRRVAGATSLRLPCVRRYAGRPGIWCFHGPCKRPGAGRAAALNCPHGARPIRHRFSRPRDHHAGAAGTPQRHQHGDARPPLDVPRSLPRYPRCARHPLSRRRALLQRWRRHHGVWHRAVNHRSAARTPRTRCLVGAAQPSLPHHRRPAWLLLRSGA